MLISSRGVTPLIPKFSRWMLAGAAGVAMAGVLLAAGVSFQTSWSVPVSEAFSSALPVVASDLDGDGAADLLLGTIDQILWFQGDGRGHVERAATLLSGKTIRSLCVGDFNADGLPDVAALTDGAVLILPAQGAGRFGPVQTVALCNEAGRGLIAVDANRDGALDLVAAQSASVVLLLGDGGGAFRSAGEFPVGQSPTALITADFNGDGSPDLATANSPFADGLSILLGSPNGTFQPQAPLSVGDRPFALAAADFNQDGKIDLAVAAESGLVLLLGKGDGSFTRGFTLPDNSRPLSIAAADLDGNGSPDLVIGEYYNGRISILLNNGDATFRESGRLPAFGDVYGLALADLNHDSRADLVATSYSSQSALVATARGNGQFEPPQYLGSLDNARLHPAPSPGRGLRQTLAVVPNAKLIRLLDGGGEVRHSIRLEDYPVDAFFTGFGGAGAPHVAVVTQHILSGNPGDDLGAAIVLLSGNARGGFDVAATTKIAGTLIPASPASSIFLIATAGDFDGDGLTDLALANNLTGTLQTYAGRGDGSFVAGASTAAGPVRSLTVADFDGDGMADLAAGRIAADQTSVISVYPGRRTATLVESSRFIYPAEPPGLAQSLISGDFNGDSRPDLAFTGMGEGFAFGVRVLLNNAGEFRAAAPIALPSSFGVRLPLAAADFDQDGRDDLVVVNGYHQGEGGSGGLLLLSNGDGSFQASTVTAPNGIVALLANRWTEGRAPDLGFLSGTTGKLTVWRNNRNSGTHGR